MDIVIHCWALLIAYIYQEIMNFTLNLTKSPYRSWGSRSPNGTWNGLVGFLIDDVIDFGEKTYVT